MTRLFLFSAAVWMLGLLPVSLNAQACPPEVPQTRVLIERFLTRPAHLPSRQQTGTTSVAPADVRLLSDGADAAACQQLNAAIGSSAGQSGPWAWSYYTAGGRFFVVAQHTDTGTTRRVGYVPLYVYDAGLRLLGAYAM